MIDKRGKTKADRPCASTVCVIQVKVKPNSRVSAFTQSDDGTWLA